MDIIPKLRENFALWFSLNDHSNFLQFVNCKMNWWKFTCEWYVRTLATLHNNFRALCSMCKVSLFFQYSSWWYGNLVITLTMSLTWRFTRGINSIILPLPTYVCFSSCCLFGEYADIRHLSQNIQPFMFLTLLPRLSPIKVSHWKSCVCGYGGGGGWGVDSTY